MKKFRVNALVLALCLLIALFAGCGNGAGSASSGAAASTEAPAATEAANTPMEAATPTPEPYPLVEEPVTLTSFYQATTNILSNFGDVYTGPTYQKAGEITGVYLEGLSVPTDAYKEQFNLLIAGGTMCDIITDVSAAYTPGIDAGIDEGIIVNLMHYSDLTPNYNAVLNQDESLYKDAHTDSGALGCFYRIFDDAQRIRSGMMIRQDWLDDLGLESPVTYEDYYDVLTAFKSEYGVAGLMLFSDLSFSLSDGYDVQLYMYGGTFHPFYQVNGDVRFGPTQPEAKEYYQMLAKWYDEGLIYSDYLTAAVRFYIPFIDQAAPVLNNQAGVINSLGELIDNWSPMIDDENAKMVGIPSPVKSAGDTLKIGSSLVITTSRLATDAGMSINAASENIELAVKYLDFWFTEEGTQLAEYGIEGETFEYVDGNPVFTELVTKNETFKIDEARKIYCAKDMPHVNAVDIIDATYSENVLNAFSAWAGNRTNEYYMSSCYYIFG